MARVALAIGEALTNTAIGGITQLQNTMTGD